MTQQVRQAAFDSRNILLRQSLFVGPTMELQCPHGRNDDGEPGLQAGLTALDVEKLLGPQVRAESRFGNNIVAQRQGRAGCNHRVAAVGDIGERPAMD